MDISKLIDRSNKIFELLEYTDRFPENDELVSLKVSLNNLLESIERDNSNFFETLMLSSPVLFDFAFNTKLEPDAQQIRNTFERQKYFYEAKKWYKFVRNSLIHTNRYTYNNFLKSIYRIEYAEQAIVYFELDQNKIYRYEEFQSNRYFIANNRANIQNEGDEVYLVANNVRIEINYQYFQQFVLEMVSNFIRSCEHDVDIILNQEVTKWKNYYEMYRLVLDNVYYDRNLDIKQLRKLAKRLRTLKSLSIEETYILCEFLVYMLNIDFKLDELQFEEILEITTFDKYYQLENRELILSQISRVKDYPRVYIDYDQVAWVLNEIHPLSSENDESLQIMEHTNYLIMYVQKYLVAKGEI